MVASALQRMKPRGEDETHAYEIYQQPEALNLNDRALIFQMRSQLITNQGTEIGRSKCKC